ncbi:MAG: MFS transporter [Candidatus Omnitrophota bacterium]
MDRIRIAAKEDGVQPSDRLYTPAFFIAFVYNFILGFLITNNALFPLYVDHAGGGPATLGMFMACVPIAGVIGRPWIGSLIDRFGVKPVLLLSCVCMEVSSLGFYMLLDCGLVPWVWMLRLVQGFGWGAHMSAFFTLAAQAAPKGRRFEAISMYALSGLASNSVGPYTGEIVLSRFGFSGFFLMLIAVGAIALLLVLSIRHPAQIPLTGDFDWRGMAQLLRSPGFWHAAVFALALAVSYSTMASFLAPLAKGRGISHFGLFFTFYSLSGVFIRIVGGKWGDRFGLRRVLLPAFMSYGTGLLILHFSWTLRGIIAAGAFCGAGHGIAFPAITSLGYALAPKSHRGRAVALVTGVMDAGNAINSFLLGQAAALWGFGIVFFLGAIGPWSAAILIAMLIKNTPKTTVPLD